MEVPTGRSVFKAQKLVKIELQHAGGIVLGIQIRGDFFMHPEENLEKLEAQLYQCPLEEPALQARIAMFLRTTQVFGFDEKSLTEAILMAAKPENQVRDL